MDSRGIALRMPGHVFSMRIFDFGVATLLMGEHCSLEFGV